MPIKDSIISGIVKYSISTWLNFVIGIVYVIVATRIMPPDTYGQLSIFYSASSVLLYVFTIGLDASLIRFYNEPPKGNTTQQVIYKTMLFSMLICILIGGGASFFFGNNISSMLFGLTNKYLFVLVIVFVFCQIILRYLNISYRMQFMVKKYNIQQILMSSLSKILVLTSALLFSMFVDIVSILVAGIFITLIVYLVIQRRDYLPINLNGELDFNFTFTNYGEYFRFALFSSPIYIVSFLNPYLNQQIIASYDSTYALGIFASTGYFVQILATMKGGFADYWTAYVYKNYETEQDKISKMHNYILILSVFFVSVIVLFRDVVYLFIGSNFHESKCFYSLQLVMPILMFVLETTGKGVALKKRNEITLASRVLVVIVNVVLSYLLIQIWGLKGVACAGAIAGLLLYATDTYFGQRYYTTIPNLLHSVIGIVAIIAILSLPAITMDMVFITIGVIIINVFVILLFRYEIMTLLHYGITTIKNKLHKNFQ